MSILDIRTIKIERIKRRLNYFHNTIKDTKKNHKEGYPLFNKNDKTNPVNQFKPINIDEEYQKYLIKRQFDYYFKSGPPLTLREFKLLRYA